MNSELLFSLPGGHKSKFDIVESDAIRICGSISFRSLVRLSVKHHLIRRQSQVPQKWTTVFSLDFGEGGGEYGEEENLKLKIN